MASNAIDDRISSGLVAFALSCRKHITRWWRSRDWTPLSEVEGKTLGAADTGSEANLFGEAIFNRTGLIEIR